MAAKPCADGSCDARSECQYKMMEEGARKYGSDAYGVGGSLIDTLGSFDVLTQFISDEDYQFVHSVKTTLT